MALIRTLLGYNMIWDRLAAKNIYVDSLNFIIQSQIAGKLHSYKSVTDEDEATNYPMEFLNSLDIPGTPSHNLQLLTFNRS